MIAPSQATDPTGRPRPAAPGFSQLSGAEQLERYRSQLRQHIASRRDSVLTEPTVLIPAAAAVGLLLGWIIKRSPLFRRH